MSLFHSSAFRNPFPGKYFLGVDLLSSLLSYSLLSHYLRPDFLTIFSSSPNSFLFSSKLYFLSQSWTVVGEISFQRGDKQQSSAEHLPLRPRASTSLLQECKGGSYIFPPRSFFLFPFPGWNINLASAFPLLEKSDEGGGRECPGQFSYSGDF